jgi:hypothetical protein
MENTTHTITVADLDALRIIVNLAATRGAFQGPELSQVGAIFDKLTAFLNSVVEQAQSANTEPLSDTTQGAQNGTND